MSRIQEYPLFGNSFGGETSKGKDKGKQPEVEEIELSLNLSLNGKFGVDKNAKTEKRVPVLVSSFSPLVPAPPLVRTCSVQVDNGEKEGGIQIIKKMAKRKRMERMSIVRAVRERIEGDGYGGSRTIYGNEVNSNLYGYGRGAMITNENNPPIGAVVEEYDAGSSPGCGSSEVSDPSGHQLIQAPKNSTEARSASLSPPEQNEQKVAVIHEIATPNVAKANADRAEKESKKKALIKAMANRGWHYVFTTLDCPNHVKVEGFLQNIGSGQPVKIVCFCHGVHYSPAEFVKHAGGEAVDNPLKHIVVTLPSVS